MNARLTCIAMLALADGRFRSGQGQFGFPYKQTVNQQALFSGNIILGTAFELGAASGINWTEAYAAPVPEPQTWALQAAGLLCVAALRRNKGRRGEQA